MLKVPVYKIVKKTKLSVLSHPDHIDMGDGTIKYIDRFEIHDPVILGVESGFTYKQLEGGLNIIEVKK